MQHEPQTDPIISIDHLSKHYGRLIAVNDLSLDVTGGEIFGFLGLNGAGKTTTIRVLLDLLRPTSGTAHVLGFDCQRDGLEVRKHIGYMPGELGFYRDMTGRDLLDLFARLAGKIVDPQRRGVLMERMELPHRDIQRKIREYSTGMKRKLGIIQAFQTDPPLLILDEPTEGLDPLMQEAFYDLASEAKQERRTIFMSSHILSEVERVCDRIGLLSKGKMVLLSPVNEVKKMVARRVRVVFDADVNRDCLDRLAESEPIEVSPKSWTLRVRGDLGGLIKLLGELPVKDFEVQEPHLEEVLIRYYRGGLA